MLAILKKMFSRNRDEVHNFEHMIGKLDNVMSREDVIRSSTNSRKQGEFKGNPMQNIPFREKVSLLPILAKNFRETQKSYDNLDIFPQKTKITDWELNQIKQKAKELGVISLGFTKVEQDDIFEGYGILYPYAIVFSIEMDEDRINKAPSFDTLVTVQETYAETAIVANKLAEFIKEMGFAAHAGPGLGGLTIYPVLAERAGIGVFGQHGLIITPEVGPRHRLAVVYTNIENLPLGLDNQHRWIKDFCAKCGKCIKKCPAGAIYESPIKTKGNYVAHIDNNACASYFAKNYGCSICVKECPFNLLEYYRIKCKFMKSMN